MNQHMIDKAVQKEKNSLHSHTHPCTSREGNHVFLLGLSFLSEPPLRKECPRVGEDGFVVVH
jgi:hypothetical protein